MTKELKQQWIEALRSGKYTQITGELKNEKGFCCLGVLHDISYNHTPREGGTTMNHYFREELISMNDKENKSFNEIADYIEQNLETN